MPLPAESLTPDSDKKAIREAMSKNIEICIKEGQAVRGGHQALQGRHARESDSPGSTTARAGDCAI